MESIILIDGNPFIWRSYFSKKSEQYVSEDIVNFFFKVFNSFDTSKVIVFWDEGHPRWRSTWFPEYKAQRIRKEEIDYEEIFSQRSRAISYLRSCGVFNISVYGVEADDLITFFSDYFSKILKYDQVVIASSDHDLWQLIDERVFVYDPMRDKLVKTEDVKEVLGILPNLIPDFKSIVGDTSDNIKGVNGLGEKFAKEFVKDFGEIEKLSCLGEDEIKKLTKSKKSSKFINDFEEAEFCKQLVKLPRINEFVNFLNEDEISKLSESVFQKVNVMSMEAQILGDVLGSSVGNEKAVSSLDQELKEVLPYIERNKSTTLSTLRVVDKEIRKCSDCILRSFCEDKGPTLAQGKSSSEIMIVGRNPGYDELQQGIPFVGKAGKRLDKFLEFIGISREECWITNVCKCYSLNNRVPTYGEIMACSHFLRAEIDLIKPKFIMCFGNESMSMLTPYKAGVTSHCGEILENPVGMIGEVKAFVGIIVHPSAALRSAANETHFQYGGKKMKEFLDGKL